MNGGPLLNTAKQLSFRLIGYPLGHSISPQIHMRLFQLSNVCARYGFLEIEPGKLGSQAAFLKSLDGFNVTIPHKQRILPLLDRIDPRARRCGAVNTVKCDGGRLYGFNTDADGFLSALKGAGIALSGRVLLCGAGGAARMMACEALERGCSLVVAARDVQKARGLQSDLAGIFPDADISARTLEDAGGSFDLILNGTPAGMYPDVGGCPVPRRVIRNSAAVFDAVYNPGKTVLVSAALAEGANAVCGLSMLIGQAAAAQEIWTGARFNPGDIETLRGEMAELIDSRYGNEPGGAL
jgi:shikimate dehydrogenase